MIATVNGERRQIASGTTLAELLRELGFERRTGIAIAVNAHVVRGAAYENHELRDGDEVEIIRAVAGG